MKKICIVTGANGFLGNNIIRKIPSDYEIRALVLPDDKINSLEGLNCKIYKGDVTDPKTLKEIFKVDKEDIVYVIHCAAIVYIKTKYNQNVDKVNFEGTKNIIEYVLKINAKLVYVNSVHALPETPKVITEITDFDPDKVKGWYAKSKAKTAKYVLEMVKEKNLFACIVHPSGLIGPYDYGSTHLTQLIIDFASGKLKASVKGGYDFVDVRDVADGILKACIYGQKGECYILSNKYITIKKMLDIVSDVRKTKKIKTILPMWIAKITAPLSEIYYKILKQPPLYTSYSLYTVGSNANFSNKKAKEKLNYKNRDIKETITDTVKWLESEGRIKKL